LFAGCAVTRLDSHPAKNRAEVGSEFFNICSRGKITVGNSLSQPTGQRLLEWSYWTGNRYESDANSSPMPDLFKQATIGAARENLPPVADRSRFLKRGGEIASGVHYVASPGHSPSHASILVHLGQGTVYAYG
jgi:hypothetical protein